MAGDSVPPCGLGTPALGLKDQGTEAGTFVTGKGESCFGGIFLKNPQLTERLGAGGHFQRRVRGRPRLSAGGPGNQTGLPIPGGWRPQASRTGQRQRELRLTPRLIHLGKYAKILVNVLQPQP